MVMINWRNFNFEHGYTKPIANCHLYESIKNAFRKIEWHQRDRWYEDGKRATMWRKNRSMTGPTHLGEEEKITFERTIAIISLVACLYNATKEMIKLKICKMQTHIRLMVMMINWNERRKHFTTFKYIDLTVERCICAYVYWREQISSCVSVHCSPKQPTSMYLCIKM